MLLELKKEIIYGPVRSRRLGASLGLNILPGGSKYCSFNCVYCQYGWTDYDGMRKTGRKDLPSREQVKDALCAALQSLPSPPAYVTLSGNGEATLHPDFPGIVDDIIEVRNRLSPAAKTAILSNSTRVSAPPVRDALRKLDVRIMKLDAGSQEMLSRYNQPMPGIRIDRIVDGLAKLGDVTIQSLFTGGPAGNSAPAEIECWLQQLERIRPIDVQIYTLDRGYPSEGILPLTREEMETILRAARAQGIAAHVF
jgi:wyosine [tRNA(Phe)-imidazoG37] synthetase (radical SAM superfamily)